MKKTKKYYEPIKLAVPASINYDELWKRVEDLKPLEKKQVKNSVYLFLSFLFPSEIYLSKYQKNGFYKNINSAEFNKLTRNRLTKVIDILYNIIDEDSSYLSGSYSKSYKLKDRYFYTAKCWIFVFLLRNVKCPTVNLFVDFYFFCLGKLYKSLN